MKPPCQETIHLSLAPPHHLLLTLEMNTLCRPRLLNSSVMSWKVSNIFCGGPNDRLCLRRQGPRRRYCHHPSRAFDGRHPLSAWQTSASPATAITHSLKVISAYQLPWFSPQYRFSSSGLPRHSSANVIIGLWHRAVCGLGSPLFTFPAADTPAEGRGWGSGR